ncbi:hypothetical protein BRADI_5g00363v3 [Brachypodium distachyon]|uniref:Transposase (putative) gypsy type domain-containing protein n=1 Tax=Brachypodium distachyon TaxID=15368 RepID=A0A0Q3E593_BRADI|nr:hypothetical protein BRADI_5g00363v3 [Brachypodium distachyon]
MPERGLLGCTLPASAPASCREQEYPRPLLGERVVFLDYVLRGLSFPLHAFFCAMLLAYGLQLHDLPPNSYLHVACFITPCECFLGVSPHWGLWKRIFMIQGQKADVVGSVNFQVRPDTKYFSLQQRKSVQGWRSKGFYVRSDAPGADPSLIAFSLKKKTKKTAAWSHELTPAEESEATPLMAKMQSLMGQGLTGVHQIALFLRMRIQPPQTCVHPGLEYPLSQPPPAGEEELADESSESTEQASDSETEELALETWRKCSRESNPKSDDQSTGVEGLLSLSGLLPSSESSLDRVIDAAASICSEAATGVQGASRVLTRLFGKMFDEPVPESLGKLVQFFSADPDPLDEFSWVQTNSGAESMFVLALAHGVSEYVLRKVASGLPLLPSGEEVALTPYFQLREELAAQLGSMASEGEAAPPSSTPASSQEVGQA